VQRGVIWRPASVNVAVVSDEPVRFVTPDSVAVGLVVQMEYSSGVVRWEVV
jgi:hypothetical protein